jgi:hypothetical protein
MLAYGGLFELALSQAQPDELRAAIARITNF